MSGVRGLKALAAATVAAYRVALLRYPAPLRARFGARMVDDFRRLLEDALVRDGLGGWVRCCALVVRDLMRPLPPPLVERSGRGRARPPIRHRVSVGRRIVEDLRGAWRPLRRRPAFTALLVGVLGAGIALNTVVFTIVEAYLLRAFPYPSAGRIVEVRPATQGVTPENSRDVFERAVAWSLGGFTLVGDPAPEVVLGARVSPDFFELHGVSPVIGRAFTEAEAVPGGPAVVVIGHDVWMNRFGGRPDVLGRTLQAYDSDAGRGLESFTIVGVLPRDFWYPNRYTGVLAPLRGPAPVRVGRLRAELPLADAREMLAGRMGAGGDGSGALPGLRLTRLQDAYTAPVRPQLVALQTAALLVLLAACASAGLLLLVRAHGRAREMNVRRALGAARGRLATHMLAEGAILAGLSGVVGVSLGWAGLRFLGGAIEARVGRSVPGGTAALHPDVAVVCAGVLLCALIGAALGAVPLWATGLRSLAGAMGSRGTTETRAARTARAALVGAQVALSVALLSAGALLVRSAAHLQSLSLGFEPDRLEAYTVGLTSEGAEEPERRVAFFRSLVERTRELPGVESAAVVRSAPFQGDLTAREIEFGAAGRTTGLPEVVPQIASPGLFAVLGVHALRGRLLDEEDGPDATPVTVISESLASALAPDADPIGMRVRFSSWRVSDMARETGDWLTVVGVVPDIADGVTGARPTLYVPHTQAPTGWMDLVVRRRVGVGSTSEAVGAIVRELDEETPVYAGADVSGVIREARAPSRFSAALLGLFSAFALVLAVVGLYGVAAYAARQRRRDVAVRLALGARRGAVEALCLRDALAALAVGLVLGLVGGRALGSSLSAQLHGVGPDDPATFASSVALVAVTALLAVWLPARRAARTDLGAVLRED